MGVNMRVVAQLLLGFVFLVTPHFAFAILDDGDKMCVPVIPQCGCGKIMGPKGCVAGPNKFMCPCKDTTGGFTTTGMCVSNFNCKGMSTSDGKTLGDLKGIMDLAKGLMDMLKPKEKGGGGGGDSGAGTGLGYNPLANLYPPCNYNDATKTYSPIPCTKSDGTIVYSATGDSGSYLGDTTGGSSVGDSLLDALNGAFDDEEIVDEEGADEEEGAGEEGDGEETTDEEEGTGDDPTVPEDDVGTIEPSSKGDIIVGDSGVTVVGSASDGTTEVAGFYGSNARNRLQAQSVAGRICASRPWAEGFFSAILPDNFFDGLCRWAGYQLVQIEPEDVSGPREKTFVAPPAEPGTKEPVVDTEVPEVDVWAEPDLVRLGTRTYIFWTSNGVESCQIVGPSFEQNSLSGGASTVTISDASTFTMTCLTPAGREVTDEVTVQLAL